MEAHEIQRVKARRVLDSRGYPTVEVEVATRSVRATAIAPSGKSTGSREAVELRDGGRAWDGKDVQKAVRNAARVERVVKGMSVFQQEDVDMRLRRADGTREKKRLGGNLLIATSMAVMRAASLQAGMPLYEWVHASSYVKKPLRMPVPFANVLNGGAHASNPLRFQEFMLVPLRAKRFTEAVRAVSESYHALQRIVRAKYGSDCVGDEGGFAPPIATAEEALGLLEEAVEEAGWKGKMRFAMDAAATGLYDAKRDAYEIAPGVWKKADELAEYYKSLVKAFRVWSIEDPFHENAYGWYARLRGMLRGKARVVADDLTVSQPGRVAEMLRQDAFDVLLLKPNQAGLVTEALVASAYAIRDGRGVMVSHRSGESEDAFISDLAVGLGVGMIKLGAPARGERTAKYNQLLRIEEAGLPYGLPDWMNE